MLRAVRLASTLAFAIEPATRAAIERHAADVAHLSGTRVGAEIERLLLAPIPSVGLRLLAETGLLGVTIPELAAQRGIPQAKIPGDDLWDHTVRTVDAVAAMRPAGEPAARAVPPHVTRPATEAAVAGGAGHDDRGAGGGRGGGPAPGPRRSRLRAPA